MKALSSRPDRCYGCRVVLCYRSPDGPVSSKYRRWLDFVGGALKTRHLGGVVVVARSSRATETLLIVDSGLELVDSIPFYSILVTDRCGMSWYVRRSCRVVLKGCLTLDVLVLAFELHVESVWMRWMGYAACERSSPNVMLRMMCWLRASTSKEQAPARLARGGTLPRCFSEPRWFGKA